MRISDWSSDVCSSDLTKLRRDARGTTLVEFALASPILIMFMLAVMQIGMTMQAYSALREVIGSGGRAAMVAYQDTSDGVMSETQVEDMIKTRASARSEEHTSELQSLMRISYAVFCLKKKKSKNDTE